MTGVLAVLLVTIAWGTLAFGAVYAWAYWPLAGACAGLGLWGMYRTRNWREGRSRTLGWCLVVVAGTIVLQVIPLPLPLFRTLSPGADHFLAQFDLGYLVEPPGSHTLSVDPAQSLIALALFAALAIFLLGLIGLLAMVPLRRLAICLALFGVVVAIIGVVNRALMDPGDQHAAIYGFWRPEQGGRPFPPFVNPNHYAGWMLLVIALTLGNLCGLIQESWQARGQQLQRWLAWLARPEAGRLVLLALATIAMTTALVLTTSRSGVAALAVVLLAFGYRAARLSQGTGRKLAVAAAVGAVLIGALAWAGAAPLVSKFGRMTSDVSAAGRAAIWRDALQIFHDFPVFGSGLGTFGRLMLVYESAGQHVFYTEAHNDYLQILAEGGLLVSAAALALILVIARTAVYRLSRDSDPVSNWIRFGAVAGLIGIATQSIVEFSLQMPGITALCTLIMAIALHRPSDRTPYAHRM